MTNDGHMIDDPMVVVGTKPDFEGLGIPPMATIPESEQPYEGMKITDFILENYDWLKVLPKDYDGETTRFKIKIAVSKKAVENMQFDLRHFLSMKFMGALRTIRKKMGFEKIYLTHILTPIMDEISDKEKTFFYFYVAIAKPENYERTRNQGQVPDSPTGQPDRV